MKQILNKVTVTGADQFTDLNRMVEIQKEFSFVEFGILLNGKDLNSAFTHRFPNQSWLSELEKHADKLTLSGHLCGVPVEKFLKDGQIIVENCPNINIFKRLQINTHAEQTFCILPFLYIGLIYNREIEFIFQLDKVNDYIFNKISTYGLTNVSGLFDLSHGAGILPTEWPVADKSKNLGYAGGLSPENVVSQLEIIETLTENTWIDAETHLRTDGKFDLDKVTAFLKNAQPWVIKH